MKAFSEIKKYTWLLLASPVFILGCSKDRLDQINKDVNHPTDVQSKFVLSDVITRTAFSNAGGDINTYVSTYVEHETGVHNQMFYSETRVSQPTSASTFNNPWGSLYTTLKNAKLIISKCSDGGKEAGNNVTKGMAEVMAAYNLALITDLFGDAPWTQAGDYAQYINPKVDKQEAIYADVVKYLDAAIVDLQKSDLTAPGSQDVLYGGVASKWLKFAYGLKARYIMRNIKRSTTVSADLQKVIDNANLSFTSASEEAAFAKYDASNLNPTFDFQWSRDGLGASRSMVDKLIARNDPRLNRVFVNKDWEQESGITTGNAAYLLMAPNGSPNEIQYYYNTSIFMFAQTAPTLLLSYHELLFLKAEAMARLGKTVAEISPVLKSAVVAAIANTEKSVAAAFAAPTVNGFGGLSETTTSISSVQAQTYYDNQVLPLVTANPLREIMNQKYIAFFGASGESTEAYNDIRRLKGLGESLITLANTKPFPLRLPYGNDDTTTNPNVKNVYGDGQYVYSVPVWWAGGSR